MPENRNISPEQTAAAVTQLQTFLQQLAFFDSRIPFAAVNGIFNDETRQALEAYQEITHLPVTGQVDRETWETLYEDYLRSQAAHSRPEAISPFPHIHNYLIPLGEESELVGILHHMLRTLRLVHDDLGELPEGIQYDNCTENAVRIYQRKNGIPGSGQVDRITWDTLAREYNQIVPQNQ